MGYIENKFMQFAYS